MAHHATILCPGPSLRLWRRDQAAQPAPLGSSIAVNSAIEAWPCRWWVMGDPECCGRFEPAVFVAGERPRLFAPESKLERLTAGQAAAAARMDSMAYTQVNGRFPAALRNHTFSLVAAVYLAAYLGAGVIDVYGADWRGDEDWRGEKSEARNPGRFDREKRAFCRASVRLAEGGVCVVRHTHYLDELTTGAMRPLVHPDNARRAGAACAPAR